MPYIYINFVTVEAASHINTQAERKPGNLWLHATELTYYKIEL